MWSIEVNLLCQRLCQTPWLLTVGGGWLKGENLGNRGVLSAHGCVSAA